MNKEGEEPIIHTLLAERDPDNENYITLVNRAIRLYAFEKILTIEYFHGIEDPINHAFFKSLMGFAEHSKSNSHSELWKNY